LPKKYFSPQSTESNYTVASPSSNNNNTVNKVTYNQPNPMATYQLADKKPLMLNGKMLDMSEYERE
jgi:hypothetical protein